MTPRIAIVLLGLLGLGARAQPVEHAAGMTDRKDVADLKVKGDPGAEIGLAIDWAPPPIGRDPEGKITSAPFGCSKCRSDGSYADGAKLPPEPDRLCQRPPDDVLSWWEKDHKLEPIVLTTDHTILVIDLPRTPSRWLVGEERDWLGQHFPRVGNDLEPHERAHLYALRYLRMEARFRDLLCLEPGSEDYLDPSLADHFGSKGRGEVYIFPGEETYREFARHFFRGFGPWTSWWWFSDGEVGVSALHAHEVTDAVLAARFDHQMAHHLFHQYRGFYHHLPVWITEGLGHHFERRHRQFADTFCILGYLKDHTWDEKHWWRGVKALVAQGDDVPLVQLALVTKLEELRPPLHSQAWSLVNFMLALGKPRWRRFVDVMKTKRSDESLPEVQYRAIETAYGVDLITFQEAWRRWVRETKPPRR